jgi:hypothetical protein
MGMIDAIPSLALAYPWSTSFTTALKVYEDKVVAIANRTVDVMTHFGAVGNKIVDDTPAFLAAWNYLVSVGGGTLYAPRPPVAYRFTTMFSPPASTGIQIVGDGTIVTKIVGDHGQDAIVNLQGSVRCGIDSLTLIGGDGGAFPKSGLVQGRSAGGGSAGWSIFNGLRISGSFSTAGLYNVASEGNSYYDLDIRLDAASTAKKSLYLSSSDGGGLNPTTPLVASTMLGATFHNPTVMHAGSGTDISCVYLDGSVAFGSVAFRGGHLAQDRVGGEQLSGTPTDAIGFNIFASVGNPAGLRGLSIRDCHITMFGGGTGRYIKQDQYVKLYNATIISRGIDRTNPASLSNMPCTIGTLKSGATAPGNGENSNCLIDVGNGIIQPS